LRVGRPRGAGKGDADTAHIRVIDSGRRVAVGLRGASGGGSRIGISGRA
jgi:hypothetical protein